MNNATSSGARSIPKSPLLSELMTLLERKGQVPEVLYHYTSAESVSKILEDKCMLATHFDYTNDQHELRYGLRIAIEATERTVNAASRPPWAEPMVRNALAMLQSEDFHAETPTFVTCFSANGDSLGQWRAYADNSRGYALAIDTRRWEYDESNAGVGVDLVKCSYDAKSLGDELAHQQEELLARVERLPTPRPSGWELDLEKALVLSAAYASMRLKHVGFQEEEEWRLIALPPAPAGSSEAFLARHVGGTFVPSVRLNLAAKGQELPLRRIVMGPYHAQALRRRAAEYGLQQLLLAKKQKAVIKASKIPYRPHL